jgi:hypothetical protein
MPSEESLNFRVKEGNYKVGLFYYSTCIVALSESPKN